MWKLSSAVVLKDSRLGTSAPLFNEAEFKDLTRSTMREDSHERLQDGEYVS